MTRIDEVRKPTCIVSTNTSGIPVKDIAEGRSKSFKQHFLGTHFFNPPRYLKLLEIIPTADTSKDVTEFISWFGEIRLGKGIVLCKDTPNFIGNRVAFGTGAFGMDYHPEERLHRGRSGPGHRADHRQSAHRHLPTDRPRRRGCVGACWQESRAAGQARQTGVQHISEPKRRTN